MMLRSSRAPLCVEYDVALLDLDGVVYLGPDAVRGAPEALAEVKRNGMRLAFVTNNAARTPQSVAQHLTELGVPADPGEVITASQAAAHHLADRFPAGSAVLVVGTTGLITALQERDLRPVTSADDDPVAVVQGYSPTADWAMLAEGAVAINRGAYWVATNLDATLPSARGPLPGNGSLVAALTTATGQRPVATGKPDPTMHRETVERSQANHPLVVGDRLDTDIEGAVAVGCDSLLVLSGVTTPRLLLSAPDGRRPNFVAENVAGLLTAHTAPIADGSGFRCGGWLAAPGPDAASVTLDGSGDQLEALRALCAVAWSSTDPSSVGTVHPSGDGARAAVAALGLD
jgi:HAD superfamily hydrolase (TIGR01450 family)